MNTGHCPVCWQGFKSCTCTREQKDAVLRRPLPPFGDPFWNVRVILHDDHAAADALADLTREGTLQHMRSIEQELFHG